MRTCEDEELGETIEVSRCPVCKNRDNPAMGKLGHKIWFRCQACGIEYNKDDRYAIQGAEID